MPTKAPSEEPERTLYEQLIGPSMRPRSDSDIAVAYEHMEGRNIQEKIENVADSVRDAARTVLLVGLPMAIALDVLSGIGRGPFPAKETFTEKLTWRHAKQRAYERMWADRSAYQEKHKPADKK